MTEGDKLSQHILTAPGTNIQRMTHALHVKQIVKPTLVARCVHALHAAGRLPNFNVYINLGQTTADYMRPRGVILFLLYTHYMCTHN